LTTKIGALVDALGNLVRFVLLPGQCHDINSIDDLLAGLSYSALIGDKAFDSAPLRERIAADGAIAVIPARRGRKLPVDFDRELYKWRHLIENFFGRIKHFRRIATRYEKTDGHFRSMLNLVAIFLWIK
jgi:transposase